MCFLVLAYRVQPDVPLLVATNRDEFYARPAAPAAFWDDAPDVLAGRDLEGGGTWMGVTRTGRFAALTNVREPHRIDPHAPTRGTLVPDFLTGTEDAETYLQTLAPTADRYNGFNLLVGDVDGLWFFSNRDAEIRGLLPGLYGLSNASLDTPWPKVLRGKAHLAQLLHDGTATPDALLDLLADDMLAPDDALPATGVGLDWERRLSAIRIVSPAYGTRVSTVVQVDGTGWLTFIEQPRDADTPRRTFVFQT